MNECTISFDERLSNHKEVIKAVCEAAGATNIVFEDRAVDESIRVSMTHYDGLKLHTAIRVLFPSFWE